MNLQQQNSLIQVLTKSFESQQEIIQNQGRQIDHLSDNAKRLTNIVVEIFQEALEDIKEPEYKEDGYMAEQYLQHMSPDGVPPEPTKSGTPPNRTKDVAGYTTPHSSFENIPEEESNESPKKWSTHVQTPAGKEAARK